MATKKDNGHHDSSVTNRSKARTLLAISAAATALLTAAVLTAAISAIMAPIAAQAQVPLPPSYTNVTDANVIGDPDEKSVIYSVTAVGNIPKKVDTFIGSKLCYGYGWYSDPNLFNGIGDPHVRPGVITTLGKITSLFQDPCQIGDPHVKKVWNTQTVTVAKPNGPVCLVSVGDPNERTSVRGNTLKTALNQADATIFPSTFELAASFELQQDSTNCPLTSTMGLKVVPISISDPDQ